MCLAAPGTSEELSDTIMTGQSLAATAYAQYIAAEVTESEVRSSITPIINGVAGRVKSRVLMYLRARAVSSGRR
jgi:hypothetical protein